MTSFDRRQLLTAGALLLAAPRTFAHNDAGEVSPPQAPPPVSLELDDGSKTTLKELFAGRVTALQLMFTVCQATCPIQGAIFGDALKKLGESAPAAQLVSLSIDPDRDTPEQLRQWLKRFGANARWRAARPDKSQLGALVSFLKSKKDAADPHTAQVYYFNRQAELVLRTVDFPPASSIAKSLQQLADRK